VFIGIVGAAAGAIAHESQVAANREETEKKKKSGKIIFFIKYCR
jgi:hypothetical protein